MFNLLFVAFLAACSFGGSDAKVSIKFKDVGCIPVDAKIVTINECNVKTYSKKVTAINIAVTYATPVDRPFMVQAVINKNNGTDFVPIMKGPSIEWCSFIETADSNYVYKFLIDLVRESCPNLFKKCPYLGRMDYLNVTIDDSKLTMMIPSGDFKTHVTMALDKAVIAAFWFIFEVK